jgi:hypothetical protein
MCVLHVSYVNVVSLCMLKSICCHKLRFVRVIIVKHKCRCEELASLMKNSSRSGRVLLNTWRVAREWRRQVINKTITGKLDRRSHCHLPYMALFKSSLIIQSFLLQRGMCVPKNRRVMEFRAIKITGFIEK